MGSLGVWIILYAVLSILVFVGTRKIAYEYAKAGDLTRAKDLRGWSWVSPLFPVVLVACIPLLFVLIVSLVDKLYYSEEENKHEK